ncbi:hypothetical protein [Alteromonas sp. KUL49]|uniref:hypothetical protein n=1 Tax=Alteromonas sp. KUL49 TaxID=2480798 RepID=UPI00102EE020|nr:hypothetical protein [Alteromonas sp. KUL49]TAP40412.1 hypothetical protein EYS00_09695 [Alteromonas sp. KUL49]GEA11577.1 hypothetical protein KUL49_19520 [Alteromonas sp. KUL49]
MSFEVSSLIKCEGVKRFFCGMLASLLLVIPSLALSSDDVVYSGTARDDYTTQLLSLALSYHGDRYNLKAFGAEIPKPRVFALLAANDGIDVIVGGASLERASKYQMIPFPLLKGLNGWRMALVHDTQPRLFEEKKTEEFKAYVAGQFHTWTDTKILSANQITVFKGTNAEGLYDMLARQRFDYFPRSVLEIEWDFNSRRHLPLAIEQTALIYYPTAYVFYVSKQNKQLAEDILVGLQQAQSDGSFEQLFNEFYGDVVNKLIQDNRSVYRLSNPFLPHNIPTERKELWLNFEG